MRVKQTCILAALLAAALPLRGQTGGGFAERFTGTTVRMDYYHTGTKGEERFSSDAVMEEGPWPGSRLNLIDTLNLGEYLVRVYDRATNQLLYSRGFSSMFYEWQTTDEALRGEWRTFSETVRFPFPRRAVQVTISRRQKDMSFREVFVTGIDPNDPSQVNRERRRSTATVSTLMENGDPSGKVDIVIVGDGYSRADMEKFRNDARHFTDVLFSTEPFKARAGDFNVRAVEVESRETGVDIPDQNVWKSTALGTRYSTFGLARYVLTDQNRALRDIAGAAPYDFICILFNDTRYGGGGIFNLYATTYTREEVKGQEWQMDYVYVHEFGHSFAGLGDEYYSSSVAYNDFYPAGVEPWEPNITASTDRATLKWKAFVASSTPLPTPWEKVAYDSLEALRAKLDRLAPDYYEKRAPLYNASQAILQAGSRAGTVGTFEGAGYAARGLFRPAVDCRMFSLSVSGFDPVCRAAIERSIDFYSR